MEIYENTSIEDLPGELWVPIEGFESLYSISNMGRVKSFYYNAGGKGLKLRSVPKIRKQWADGSGYLFIMLKKGEKYKCFRIHRYVAKYFVPNPNNYPEVNHKGGNKNDNRASELEWNTRLQNIAHAWKNGLFPKIVGQQQSSTKLKDHEVLEIFNSDLGARHLGRVYNIDHKCILGIRSGKNWSHLTGKIYEPRSNFSNKH